MCVKVCVGPSSVAVDGPGSRRLSRQKGSDGLVEHCSLDFSFLVWTPSDDGPTGRCLLLVERAIAGRVVGGNRHAEPVSVVPDEALRLHAPPGAPSSDSYCAQHDRPHSVDSQRALRTGRRGDAVDRPRFRSSVEQSKSRAAVIGFGGGAPEEVGDQACT